MYVQCKRKNECTRKNASGAVSLATVCCLTRRGTGQTCPLHSWQALAHTCTLSLSHTPSRSLTQNRSYTRTRSHTRARAHTHTHTHTRTHTLSLSHTRTLESISSCALRNINFARHCMYQGLGLRAQGFWFCLGFKVQGLRSIDCARHCMYQGEALFRRHIYVIYMCMFMYS